MTPGHNTPPTPRDSPPLPPRPFTREGGGYDRPSAGPLPCPHPTEEADESVGVGCPVASNGEAAWGGGAVRRLVLAGVGGCLKVRSP